MQIVDYIIRLMLDEVQKYGLELMQRYPNDLLVHDRAVLERGAKTGAVIAWMVGHSHTHIVLLGLHPKENEMTPYLTNLCSDDRFYVIRVGAVTATMEEIGREKFAALSNTKVPYAPVGEQDNFLLTKNGRGVGHVSVSRAGSFDKPVYNVDVTPVIGISELDMSTLHLWGNHAATGLAGSLFIRTEISWKPAYRLADAA